MGLLHYCTFELEAANDTQNVRFDRARGKDNNQQNISQMIQRDIAVYIIKSFQLSEYINNLFL